MRMGLKSFKRRSREGAREKKQGRIHGNPVADSWAGAVMQKPLGIQKCDGRTDLPTDTARWSQVSVTKNLQCFRNKNRLRTFEPEN